MVARYSSDTVLHSPDRSCSFVYPLLMRRIRPPANHQLRQVETDLLQHQQESDLKHLRAVIDVLETVPETRASARTYSLLNTYKSQAALLENELAVLPTS